MKTVSIISDNIQDLETQMLDYLKQGNQPTLAVVFCSPDNNLDALSRLFDTYNIDVLGCTSSGEIRDEALETDAISCLMMDVSKESYRLFMTSNLPNGQAGTEGVVQMGQRIRLQADAAFKNPAMVVCSAGVFNDGEKVVEGLKTEREIPIFGGLAGDNLQMKDTYIFTRTQQSNNAIAAIVFDNDKIELSGSAISGWESLGSTHTVTKAQDNVIFTINQEPALDFFIRFFGEEGTDLKGQSISNISAQYPFQMIRDEDYSVLRCPMISDETTRSLTMISSMKAGDQFRFSISPGVEVVNKTIEEFSQSPLAITDADALIMFSCIGRRAALGPFLEDEISGLYNIWEKPMIGFLTYGEIGNLKNGVCEFHNETCSLVLIKEK
jgi:hypothetical protein